MDGCLSSLMSEDKHPSIHHSPICMGGCLSSLMSEDKYLRKKGTELFHIGMGELYPNDEGNRN